MKRQPLKIGARPYMKGCFTTEYFIRGLSVKQIGAELGLPVRVLKDGIYVAFAERLPAYHGFKLGGWAEYSTDNFVNYKKGGRIKWREKDFEKTYEGKRVPISIADAKKAWLDGMRHEKLIKVLPLIPYLKEEKFPKGGKAAQIIVTHPIRCHVVKFLKFNQLFKGVWS